MEPLLIKLIKGYVDDDDLTRRLRALYQVSWNRGVKIAVQKRKYLCICSKKRLFFTANVVCSSQLQSRMGKRGIWYHNSVKIYYTHVLLSFLQWGGVRWAEKERIYDK